MTCLVIRGSIFAADSRMTVDETTPYPCEKLYRVKDGILGMAGDSGPGFELLHHLRVQSCKVPLKIAEYHRKDFGALLLTKYGVYLYADSLFPDRVYGKFFAMGSGAGIALGAMDYGATAIEAVRAACRWDVNCGGPVRWMRL